MQAVILGTASMVPTKDRNHTSIFVSYSTEGLLFDCGEGTQRQLTMAGIKPSKVSKVFISHWHGDHTLGLVGLMQTLSKSDYTKTLVIFGPKGTKQRIDYMLKAFAFENTIEFSVKEISKDGKFLETSEYTVEAYSLEHGVDCLGYRFIEKDKVKVDMGKAKKLGLSEGPLVGRLQRGQSVIFKKRKIVPSDVTYKVKGKIFAYISDTIQCNNCFKIANEADLLISECTYLSDLEDKADDYMHLTASQVANIAAESNVKKLVLIHYSNRYKQIDELVDEVKTVFPNVIGGFDLMKVKI